MDTKLSKLSQTLGLFKTLKKLRSCLENNKLKAGSFRPPPDAAFGCAPKLYCIPPTGQLVSLCRVLKQLLPPTPKACLACRGDCVRYPLQARPLSRYELCNAMSPPFGWQQLCWLHCVDTLLRCRSPFSTGLSALRRVSIFLHDLKASQRISSSQIA